MNLRRFTLVYLALILAMMVLVVLVQAVTGFDIANAGMAIIPAMGAAMIEGQKFARREGRQPESAQMWRFARQSVVIILGLSMVAVMLFSVTAPEIKMLLSQQYGGALLLGALLFQVAVSFILVRHFVGLGARSVLGAPTGKGGRG
ncbi:ABZJ_00895 family protein [Phaeobacter sp. B1627]|uniref:ABZJ_00895 family protein n=1 Tax=Phaeobacter sp. B1627 TaxID=2583809 RepID=UPI00111A178C|nr:ABZJ_00895 family protein [Phaeobacter sp. B1627]TNJ41159.1 hypothetical protein FGE21_15105 [Phaeobacter sp. B1627]